MNAMKTTFFLVVVGSYVWNVKGRIDVLPKNETIYFKPGANFTFNCTYSPSIATITGITWLYEKNTTQQATVLTFIRSGNRRIEGSRWENRTNLELFDGVSLLHIFNATEDENGTYTGDFAASFGSDSCIYKTVLFEACVSGPCQNKGICRETKDGYACDCPVGYDGDVCQNMIFSSREELKLKEYTTFGRDSPQSKTISVLSKIWCAKPPFVLGAKLKPEAGQELPGALESENGECDLPGYKNTSIKKVAESMEGVKVYITVQHASFNETKIIPVGDVLPAETVSMGLGKAAKCGLTIGSGLLLLGGLCTIGLYLCKACCKCCIKCCPSCKCSLECCPYCKCSLECCPCYECCSERCPCCPETCPCWEACMRECCCCCKDWLAPCPWSTCRVFGIICGSLACILAVIILSFFHTC